MTSEKSVDLLRHGAYVRFLYVRIAASIALQVQAVAVGWLMYELTRSPFQLGLVGLVQFIPSIGLFLATGHAADRYDRRTIVFMAQVFEALAVTVLAFATATGRLTPHLLLTMAFCIGIGRAFEQPSLQTALPNIVPASVLPRAIAGSTSAAQIAIVAGPALGGLLIALSPTLVFATCAVLWLSAGIVMRGITMERRLAPREPVDLKRLFSGLVFIGQHKVVLGAILLDLFAVLLGNATALLPIFVRDIFMSGPLSFGALRAAPAAGALVTALALTRWPIARRVGHIMPCGGNFRHRDDPAGAVAHAAVCHGGDVHRRRLGHRERGDPAVAVAFAHAGSDARPGLCGGFDVHRHLEPTRRLPRRRRGGGLRHHPRGADWRLLHHRGCVGFDPDFPRTLSSRSL
jgi:MFS family permease